MEPTSDAGAFQLDEALTLLEATPGVLRSLLQSLPHDWLYFEEDPEAWSPFMVLVHYIHNEKTNWVPRVRVVLSEDAVRKFPSFHQLPDQTEQGDGSVSQLLAEFTQLRQENLAFIRSLHLQPDDFDREAEHPYLGVVNLRHLLATWVVHDLNHLHQIAKSLAKRYQASVGPWRHFLGILDL